MLDKWWSWISFQWSSKCCHMWKSNDDMWTMLRFAMSREMLIANVWCSYHGGKGKCGDVALQAGASHKMWMGFCTVINFVVSPGQMRVIPGVTVEDAEVSIYTFGAIDEGMLMLWAFLICSRHLVVMLTVFLVYRAVMQNGGLASSWRGALILQNCPLVFLHMLNWWYEISTAIVSSHLTPRYWVFTSYHAVKFPWGISKVKILYTESCCIWSCIGISISSKNCLLAIRMWVCRYL